MPPIDPPVAFEPEVTGVPAALGVAGELADGAGTLPGTPEDPGTTTWELAGSSVPAGSTGIGVPSGTRIWRWTSLITTAGGDEVVVVVAAGDAQTGGLARNAPMNPTKAVLEMPDINRL